MEVTSQGVCLGVRIGPQAEDRSWDKVITKLWRGTRRLSQAYGLGHVLCEPSLRSVGEAGYSLQVRRPGAALIHADRAASATVLQEPLHAIGPGLLPLYSSWAREVGGLQTAV